ncbi:radical SAM protein [Pyrobaculum neutrophilum]|uniref:Radical SAM domain protein n=1 Tax=Pyrobaculum neutrophilum (strain DSM 2338 / JCM 9278 / NBRC 100436 / V24Sta) TaxID=444157 RepID=B1YCE9_PYRNV|nr:radical SAM protein [Pyrobaculum neutrophilum]ACB39462.1 Radical SAM domain protein [Pyrobaculum neutrophilum V24Sta]
MTLIYHITYYPRLRSAYLQFDGCNYVCPWCIRRLTPWDHHLPDAGGLKTRRHLTLGELVEVVSGLRERGAVEAVLGGGEPTVDPELPQVVKTLAGLRVRILTNGFSISEELLGVLRSCPACEVVVSVKTLDPARHLAYTGKPLGPVLANVKRLVEAGVAVKFETVLIPGLNDVEDVEEIARYIGEVAGPDAVLIIDPLIPIPGTPWRRPAPEEVEEAHRRASRYVKTARHGGGGPADVPLVVFPPPGGYQGSSRSSSGPPRPHTAV